MVRYRSGAAFVGLAAMMALFVALALIRRPDGAEEKLSTASKQVGVKDAATERAISKIKQRMMKSLHINVGVKKPESKASMIRDKMLKVESQIGQLKVSASNLFAKWEKERTIARDAKTKAVSLNELLKQDKTKERMEEQNLDNLKAKLGNQLAVQIKNPTGTTKKQVFTEGVARNDLKSYFANLNRQDKLKENAEHAKNVKQQKANVASSAKAVSSEHGNEGIKMPAKKAIAVQGLTAKSDKVMAKSTSAAPKAQIKK